MKGGWCVRNSLGLSGETVESGDANPGANSLHLPWSAQILGNSQLTTLLARRSACTFGPPYRQITAKPKAVVVEGCHIVLGSQGDLGHWKRRCPTQPNSAPPPGAACLTKDSLGGGTSDTVAKLFNKLVVRLADVKTPKNLRAEYQVALSLVHFHTSRSYHQRWKTTQSPASQFGTIFSGYF